MLHSPSTKPKRLLILTAYYPPKPDVAGIRYAEFASYLPEFGWSARVLTIGDRLETDPRSPIWRVPLYFYAKAGLSAQASQTPGSRAQSSLVSRLLPLANQAARYVLIPDGLRFWSTHRFYNIAEKLVQRYGADAILVSCAPFSLPLAGLKLKQRFSIPVALDFRDGLTLNPYQVYPPVLEPVYRAYEQGILQRADRLITTTPLTTDAYKRRYPFLSDRSVTINNGFDEQLFQDLPSEKELKFTLAYAGVIDEHRSIDSILRAFLSLNLSDAQVIIMGGIQKDSTLDLIACNPAIHFRGQIPRPDTLRQLKRSHLLLVNQGFDIKTDRCFPIAAKTYEYLRLGVPILCLAPEGDNTALVREYCAQPSIVTENKISTIALAIQSAYTQWNGGAYRDEVNENFRRRFNRRALTQRLASVLDEIVQKPAL